MNGFLLLIPFLLIRFPLLSRLNSKAIKRAAHFPNMQGNEVIAYWIYQVSNVLIFIYLCFLTINTNNLYVFISGNVCYWIGLLLCAITIFNFSKPSSSGFNHNGLYQYSRNPMYVSYFIFFIGCAFLTNSKILLGIVIIFQLSAHCIILSEERWCLQTFGETYRQYIKDVRRYF